MIENYPSGEEPNTPLTETASNQCPGCGLVDKSLLSQYCLRHIKEMRDNWYLLRPARGISRDEGIVHLEHQEAFRVFETDRGADSRELKAEYRMVERLWNRLLGVVPRGGV